MKANFPDYWDAPFKLLLLESNCGPIAAWGVLRYFRKRVSSETLIKSCRHSRRDGVYAIALALALRELGLSVTYHSDPDPTEFKVEKRYKQLAKKIGVKVEKGIGLNSLSTHISEQSIPIVLYETNEGNGHFAPVLGFENNKLMLAYSDERIMSRSKFLKRWKAEGIFRQCVVASRK